MEKETIIFLHGIVGNQKAFKTEMAILKEQYHCIAYDYFDPRDLAAGDRLSLEFLVEQLYQQFIKAGIKKAHLCTFSFGCIVAMAFTNKYPHMVRSLTFVGGYRCDVPSKLKQNLTRMLEGRSQHDHNVWVRQCARLMNPNKESIAEDSEMIFTHYAHQIHPDIFEQALRVHSECNTEAALSGLDKPILWVMGEFDDLYKGTLTDLKQVVPHVEYQEIKNGGHAAHIHQPQPFMSMFQSFLVRNRALDKDFLSVV